MQRRILPLAVPAVLAAALVAGTGVASASSTDTGRFAPLDRPGPAYTESAATLAAALDCDAANGEQTVLLVPGTFIDPATNYDSTYRPALRTAGFRTCTVTLPNATTGDAQAAGERIAYAIRTIGQDTARKVDVLGYSQGGLDPRFAFRFFPDTRNLVDDFVALDPTNHGTYDANVLCTVAACQPGVLQQRKGSDFIAAVNSGQETFAPISYTTVFTRTDEVATPNLTAAGTSALHTGDGTITNIALQNVCPTDLSEHLAVGTVDNTAYQIALDAFTHPGTATPARIAKTVCAQPFLPGVSPAKAARVGLTVGAVIANNVATQPTVTTEPALRPYTLR